MSSTPSPFVNENVKFLNIFSFMSMNIQTKQSVLKKMLTAIGQDPKSEEHIDDPRLISKFISINRKVLKELAESESGKTFRIGNWFLVFAFFNNKKVKLRNTL